MGIALWVLAFTLFLLSAGCIVANFAIVLGFVMSRKTGSTIPLFGGISGAAACLISPASAIRPCWWVSPLVDPGCGFLLISTIFHWIGRASGQHNNNT